MKYKRKVKYKFSRKLMSKHLRDTYREKFYRDPDFLMLSSIFFTVALLYGLFVKFRLCCETKIVSDKK